MDNKNNYFLFISPLNQSVFQDVSKRFQKITIPLSSYNRFKRILYEQFVIPYYVRKYKIDILFSPGNWATLFPGCKQVLTIHGPLSISAMRKSLAPGEISLVRSIFYRLMLPLSSKRSDRIIVVSKDFKKWLLRQVRIHTAKISVIYEGVDFDKFYNASNKHKPAKFKKPYLLFVSTLFKYKNADKLIRAFVQLKKENKVPHGLVIVGADPKNQVELFKQLAFNSGVKNEVLFAGRISHEQTPLVYRHADAFIYPSSFESFGLPILEAMACGVPVIGSNRASIPEIIGDAGLIVDPDDINKLAEVILNVIMDNKLRETLINRGYQRAKEFSWEKAAIETIKVFEEVYNSIK